MATVAHRIIAALKASGVERVYGLPGDSLNGFTDAIRRSDGISWEHVRHEEAAAFAHDGPALTGRLAVCVGSCGPGNLHNATVIQVDIRGRHLGRRTSIDLGLVGTVKDTITALQPLLHQKHDHDHLDRAVKHYRKTRKSLDALAVNDRDRAPIRPEYVADLVDRIADDDAVFTFDVGSPVIWAARYLTMNGRRRLIGSSTHGTMAGALPHAIGAQTPDRHRQVIALAGDGGLTMLFGELVTLTQNNLPVKVVVFNNSSLKFVELEMKGAGIVNFGTDLHNPDFAAVAQALGMFGRRVENLATSKGRTRTRSPTTAPPWSTSPRARN